MQLLLLCDLEQKINKIKITIKITIKLPNSYLTQLFSLFLIFNTDNKIKIMSWLLGANQNGKKATPNSHISTCVVDRINLFGSQVLIASLKLSRSMSGLKKINHALSNRIKSLKE